MALVTLETAKLHCRVTDARQDADVQRFVDQATAIVLDYLVDNAAAATWTPETVPKPVELAVLMFTQYYYRRNRGDDNPRDLGMIGDTWTAQEVWTEVRPILIPYRPPVFS
jgi:hypothetical protein